MNTDPLKGKLEEILRQHALGLEEIYLGQQDIPLWEGGKLAEDIRYVERVIDKILDLIQKERAKELRRLITIANRAIDNLSMAERISGGERIILTTLSKEVQDRLKELEEPK